MNSRSVISLLALSTFTPQISSAQGSLTPPAGPPVASMKTLDQVEARTPLVAGAAGVAIDAAGTITISLPGSYYLTGNRTVAAPAHGIVVSSDDVTLDLNGYSLICKTGSGGTAVRLNGAGVTLRNGTIRGGTTYDQNTRIYTPAGWALGVSGNVDGATADNIRVFNCAGTGISLSSGGSVVTNCHVKQCGDFGIAAHIVSHCVVTQCAHFGIASTKGSVSFCSVFSQTDTAISCSDGCVTDSRGETFGVGAAAGISAETVSNSVGFSQNGTGVQASVITNSRGSSTLSTGLNAYQTATGSSGSSQQGIGLWARTATGCYGSSTSGTYGMDIAGTATTCRAARNGGTALRAAIAVSCTAESGTITAPQKHLGTP